MSMREPGLDRHEWESAYEALEPQLRDSPQEALPDLADLVEQMLAERGFDTQSPPGGAGAEREVLAEFVSARDVALRCERGEADPGDVGAAVEGLRGVFEYLVAERSSP